VLTEPSVSPEARRSIAKALLAGKVSDPAGRVVEAAVAERWSRSRDLVDALEWCAVSAEAARADRSGELDAVEDDLFRFGRILEANPQLREALSDLTATPGAKQHLMRDLLDGKVNSITLDLLLQLVTGRHRSLAAGLERYAEIAAARRQRLVATAWVAAPLTDDQTSRIARQLEAQYSREVHLNVVVEPAVLGGVRIAIGDDVIDSTIQTRLAEATRMIAR
jgi:F-type H+-transporting ATPase subunit delta